MRMLGEWCYGPQSLQLSEERKGGGGKDSQKGQWQGKGHWSGGKSSWNAPWQYGAKGAGKSWYGKGWQPWQPYQPYEEKGNAWGK